MSLKMNSIEQKAVIGLSSILSLRMIGLFMVLPIFTLYAQTLSGATPLLIGLAVGIYGLAQAIFQIPLGALSDHIGRKPIILMGLIIFILGSLVCAFSHSIFLMILGRLLQGVGAIGSTILAFIADFTREEQRTKSMAIAGITIGFSFSIAMFLGPVLTQWMPVNQLFLIASVLGISAMILLYTVVPTPTIHHWQRDTEPELKSFLKMLIRPELAKLNSGILILHALFTASFVIIPLSLLHFGDLPASRQWHLYLPTLLAGFFICLLAIGLAERKRQIKPYFLGAILTLAIAELCLWASSLNEAFAIAGLCLFFGAFSLLEAFLPSLISRTAPAGNKGTALGIYSSSQFLGIFVGGVLGGWLYSRFSFSGVYLFCITLALFWFILAYRMQPPLYLITQTLKLLPNKHPHWELIAAKLQSIPGMIEITLIAEDSAAYLKMERETAENPDFLRLKEQLQSM